MNVLNEGFVFVFRLYWREPNQQILVLVQRMGLRRSVISSKTPYGVIRSQWAKWIGPLCVVYFSTTFKWLYFLSLGHYFPKHILAQNIKSNLFVHQQSSLTTPESFIDVAFRYSKWPTWIVLIVENIGWYAVLNSIMVDITYHRIPICQQNI